MTTYQTNTANQSDLLQDAKYRGCQIIDTQQGKRIVAPADAGFGTTIWVNSANIRLSDLNSTNNQR
jgi:hypothetical protein